MYVYVSWSIEFDVSMYIYSLSVNLVFMYVFGGRGVDGLGNADLTDFGWFGVEFRNFGL